MRSSRACQVLAHVPSHARAHLLFTRPQRTHERHSNYSSGPAKLLEVSPWKSNPEDLREFLRSPHLYLLFCLRGPVMITEYSFH